VLEAGASHGANGFAFKVHLSAGWLVEPQDGLHQGGLAAAAFADDGDGLTLGEVKGHAVHGMHLAGTRKGATSQVKPHAQATHAHQRWPLSRARDLGPDAHARVEIHLSQHAQLLHTLRVAPRPVHKASSVPGGHPSGG